MRHYLVVGRWLCPFAHCSTPIFVKRSINIHSHFFHDLCYSYHATAALEEAQKLARQKIPSAAALQLHSFTFDDFGLENDEMLQVTKKSFAVHPHFGLFSPNYVGSGCVRGVEKWKKDSVVYQCCQHFLIDFGIRKCQYVCQIATFKINLPIRLENNQSWQHCVPLTVFR